MDKISLMLELYSGRTINQEPFEKLFNYNGTIAYTKEREYIHYFEDEYGRTAFQIHAYIADGYVASVCTHKFSASDSGHFRPSIMDKPLTSAEMKKALEVFDECFPHQATDEVDPLIQKAVASKVSFDGYAIEKATKSGVSYSTSDGSKGRISRSLILMALDYSHVDLSILRDLKCCEDFARCIDKKPWQPLAALLSLVEPTAYRNYLKLDYQYRINRLEEAVSAQDQVGFLTYSDVLPAEKNRIPRYVETAARKGNIAFAQWIIEQTRDIPYSLNGILSLAIGRNEVSVIEFLLQSGKLTPSKEEGLDPRHPMLAARESKDVDLQICLLKLGFIGPVQTETLSLNQIRELIPYGLPVNDDMWNKVVAAGQNDLIARFTAQMESEGQSLWLMKKYVEAKRYDWFEQGIEKHYEIQDSALLEKCMDVGFAWSDRLLAAGYDINGEKGTLLEHAVCVRDLIRTEYLLNHGADVNACKVNLAEKAVEWPVDEELCVCLLHAGVDFCRCYFHIFQYLSVSFKRMMIDYLSDHNLINVPDANGHLPLYYAVSRMQEPDDGIIEYFIEKGAVVNAAGISNDKLFYETFSNFEKEDHVWKRMLEKGADVNEEKRDRNALAYAMLFHADIEHVRYLLEAGVNVNFVFHENKIGGNSVTALDVAIADDEPRMQELLRSYGAKTLSELKC